MRLLALIGAGACAAAAWFVLEFWRVARDEDDEEPDDEPTDEELDRLTYASVVGMPTHHPYSLLV